MPKVAIITQARMVNGGKVQLQVQQFIENEVQAASLLQKYNSSDDRFTSNNKDRFAWLTVDVRDLGKVQEDFLDFPAKKVAALPIDGTIDLDITAPSWNLEIEERDYAKNDYEKENPDLAAKQLEITEGLQGLATRAKMSKGRKGVMCSDLIRLDKEGELVGQRGYFLTMEGNPIFQDIRVVPGKPDHLKYPAGEWVLVHESEVPFVINEIDLTKGANRKEVVEMRKAAQVKTT